MRPPARGDAYVPTWSGALKKLEKPAPEEAPSNMAVVGRYILNATIFNMLEDTQAGSGNEIQLTDAIAKQLETQSIYAYEFSGRRYDCGSKLGYLQATVEYGVKHPEVGERFAKFLSDSRRLEG